MVAAVAGSTAGPAGAAVSVLAASSAGFSAPPQPARNSASRILVVPRSLRLVIVLPFLLLECEPANSMGFYQIPGHRGLFSCGDGSQAARQLPLLFRGQREHVAHQELGVVAGIAAGALRVRAGENPAVALAAEQAGGHGGARSEAGRVEHPALRPARLQALLGQEEVGSGGAAVVP